MRTLHALLPVLGRRQGNGAKQNVVSINMVPFALLVLFFSVTQSTAFTVVPSTIIKSGFRPSSSPLGPLFATLPEVGDMKVGDMREELESYGISTKSLLEKKEFVAAIEKARAEGKKPVNKKKEEKKADPKKAEEPKTGSTTRASREERLKEEMEKAREMKVLELREKLKQMGISTKSFFEKTDFVRAYAEAVVDGVKKKSGGSTSQPQQEEDYDPSYRDVAMQKFDGMSKQLLLQGTLIDIKL